MTNHCVIVCKMYNILNVSFLIPFTIPITTSIYRCCSFLLFRAKHAEAELKKKKNELKNTEKEYNKDKVLFDEIQKNIKKLEVL